MALVGFLLQITILFSYWTSCEFTLPCICHQWRKWRRHYVIICSTERDRQSRWSVAYPIACMC